MYWEESECAWSFKPTFSQQTFSSDTPFRMTRRLVDPATDRTFKYWQQKDTSFGKTKSRLRYRIDTFAINILSTLTSSYKYFFLCILANYVLMGKYDAALTSGSWMEYQLVSSVQVENGRRMFWPHFGFFYKAVATKISVHMYDLSSASLHTVVDLGLVNPVGNAISKDTDWKYLSKNLSALTEFTSMWDANTEKLWQVLKIIH